MALGIYVGLKQPLACLLSNFLEEGTIDSLGSIAIIRSADEYPYLIGSDM